MTTKNGDLPAMPVVIKEPIARVGITSHYGDVQYAGLTKREMFAMAAMQGLCANSIAGSHHTFKNLAAEAVAYADALLAELERTNGL